MHECLLCRRDMKVSNDIFGNGCIKNIYSFLDLKMPKKVKLREETLYKNVMELTGTHSIYNLASFSIKCGVMKEYDIDIKIHIEEFEGM